MSDGALSIIAITIATLSIGISIVNIICLLK